MFTMTSSNKYSEATAWLATASMKTLSYLVTCNNWGGSEAGEYRPLVCMEEGKVLLWWLWTQRRSRRVHTIRRKEERQTVKVYSSMRHKAILLCTDCHTCDNKHKTSNGNINKVQQESLQCAKFHNEMLTSRMAIANGTCVSFCTFWTPLCTPLGQSR